MPILTLTKHHSVLADLFQWDRIKRGKEFAKGFPGIVLTATIGRLIDGSYDPRNRFYDINPRPLFEQHIGPMLRDKYKAPMGKSDPLNVAKNATVIDETWASGRRPEKAAMAAVNFIAWLSDQSQYQLEALLRTLVWCYLALARLYTRELPTIDHGIDLHSAHQLLTDLIDNAPAGGDTAQVIVGAVLQAQHDLFAQAGILDGIGESVNATNTTAGKPGDFSELFEDQLHIYEVTTKKVDLQRIGESADAVLKYMDVLNDTDMSVEVTFLCPLDQVHIDSSYKVSTQPTAYIARGIKYNFVDLADWLFYMLERIGTAGRTTAFEMISHYIQSPSTKLEVKGFWEKRAPYLV